MICEFGDCDIVYIHVDQVSRACSGLREFRCYSESFDDACLESLTRLQLASLSCIHAVISNNGLQKFLLRMNTLTKLDISFCSELRGLFAGLSSAILTVLVAIGIDISTETARDIMERCPNLSRWPDSHDLVSIKSEKIDAVWDGQKYTLNHIV